MNLTGKKNVAALEKDVRIFSVGCVLQPFHTL